MTRTAQKRPRKRRFVFRLYIAGNAPHSERARANLHQLCKRHIGDDYAVDVIDVFAEPLRALEDSVFVTPTLVKISPPPTRTVVGDLSEEGSALAALGLVESEEP